jgi:hypothetical protein
VPWYGFCVRIATRLVFSLRRGDYVVVNAVCHPDGCFGRHSPLHWCGRDLDAGRDTYGSIPTSVDVTQGLPNIGH